MKGRTFGMPSRNVIREFAQDNYYHVYNRGVEKRVIFMDDKDYRVFLNLFKKYLSVADENQKKKSSTAKSLSNELDLLAYCLMPNHFHLLFYQKNVDSITKLMRRVITAYVMYFNNRYQRNGALFQGKYKASHVNSDAYLHHVSRYIHLNPDEYKSWDYSSYSNYVEGKKTEWVNTGIILDLFDKNPDEYRKFVDSYIETRAEQKVLKWQLADGDEY